MPGPNAQVPRTDDAPRQRGVSLLERGLPPQRSTTDLRRSRPTEGANPAGVNLSGKADSGAHPRPVGNDWPWFAAPSPEIRLSSTEPQAPATPLLHTPLHALHLELGARMVPFAGYEMPVQYPAGLMAEHHHTRQAASLFDVSHMGQLFVSGEGADSTQDSYVIWACPQTPGSCRLWFAQYTTDLQTPDAELRDFQLAIFAQDQPILESQEPKALPLSGGEAMSAADRLSAAYRRYLKACGIGFGVC